MEHVRTIVKYLAVKYVLGCKICTYVCEKPYSCGPDVYYVGMYMLALDFTYMCPMFLGPPGMRHFPPGPGGRGYGRDGPDDYDEELRAFSRKREREKRRRQDSSSESSDSPSDKEEGEEVEPRKKRKASKGKEKPKKAKKPKKDLSDEGTYVRMYIMACWNPKACR